MADSAVSDVDFVARVRTGSHDGPNGDAVTDLAESAGGLLWSFAQARVSTLDDAADAPPVRWTALWCTMPTRPSRLRLSAWRELTRLGALSLHRSTWAVPHGEAGPPELQPLFDIVAGADGDARARVIDGSGTDDVDLSLRLADTCEHLWDAFFNDVDRLSVRLAARATDDDDGTVRVFAALRRRYAELFAQDIVGSSASERAWWRLRACGDELERAADGATVSEDERRLRHSLDSSSAIAEADGLIRYTVSVKPLPSDSWERAFRDFEVYLYGEDPARIPLEHGAFLVRARSRERDDVVARLARRIEHFEQSLG